MTAVSVILILAKISIMLMVFTLGLRANFSDLTYLFRNPGRLARAVLSINILVPVFVVIVVRMFQLNPAVEIALVVLSVSPVPPILPNKALKAGGKEPYTIGMLSATSLLSVIVVPVMMKIFQAISGVQLTMSALAVASLVLSSVLGPLIVGVTVHTLFPSLAERAARPVGLVATILLLLALVPILLGSVRAIFVLIGDGTLLVLASMAVFGLLVGHLLGPNSQNRVVLALATASRHPAIAIAIAHTNFPEQKLVPAAVLLYMLISAVLSAPYINWTRKSIPPAQTNAAKVDLPETPLTNTNKT